MELYKCEGLKIEESGKFLIYDCCNLLEEKYGICSTCKDIVLDIIYLKQQKQQIYQLFKRI
jgi:hypothetical protein